MFSNFRWVLVPVMFVLGSSAASGDLLISYTGGTVQAGGLGVLNVWVSSNADFATPEFWDVLDSFSAEFWITPVGPAVPNGLQFSDPQNDSQLGAGTYVFASNSVTPPPLGTVSTTVNTNDTYIGGDATLSGLGVELHSGLGPFLLFRLDLDATLAAVGDQFTISLVDSPSTSFVDTSFMELALDVDSFDAFTVTAVPEPGSGLVLLCGALAGIWWQRRRRNMPDFAT